MNQILIPVDGSQGAKRAAQFGAKLARDTGAKLTLLYVYDAPRASLLGLEHRSQTDIDRIKESIAREALDSARRAIGDTPAATDVIIGHPSEEIITYAKQKGTDMVVMGHRGLSKLESFMLGSVSDYVVRHAPCPVTIAP